jgi:hypothetical protein
LCEIGIKIIRRIKRIKRIRKIRRIRRIRKIRKIRRIRRIRKIRKIRRIRKIRKIRKIRRIRKIVFHLKSYINLRFCTIVNKPVADNSARCEINRTYASENFLSKFRGLKSMNLDGMFLV